MIKKILLSLLIFSTLFVWTVVYADQDWNAWESEAQKAQALEKRNQDCDAGWNCLDRPSFMIDTDNFAVWSTNMKKTTWTETINYSLWVIIQKLMIILWTLALVIISIWAYNMIMYAWDDSTLTKWKNAIKAWILSLIVALSSYYIVNLVWYILYK